LCKEKFTRRFCGCKSGGLVRGCPLFWPHVPSHSPTLDYLSPGPEFHPLGPSLRPDQIVVQEIFLFLIVPKQVIFFITSTSLFSTQWKVLYAATRPVPPVAARLPRIMSFLANLHSVFLFISSVILRLPPPPPTTSSRPPFISSVTRFFQPACWSILILQDVTISGNLKNSPPPSPIPIFVPLAFHLKLVKLHAPIMVYLPVSSPFAIPCTGYCNSVVTHS